MVQRFTSHFLEAGLDEHAAVGRAAVQLDATIPQPSACRIPLQPSAGLSMGVTFSVARAAAAGDPGAGSAAMNNFGGGGGGAAAATGPAPDQPAVIPPMKRRLITLSTAGNLKISPLSNQQFYHHRVYPVRRPSDGGGAAAAGAAAVAAEAAFPQLPENLNLRDFVLQQQPPPPPSTPSRHPHTPSTQLTERRQLSPRDDNILILHVSGEGGGGGGNPSLEPPPLLQIGTPRGACSSDGIATPRLVLRPVRPHPERLYEGCTDDAENPPPAPPYSAPGVAWQRRQQCVTIEVVRRRSTSGLASEFCLPEESPTEPAPVSGAAVVDPRVGGLLEVDPSGPEWPQAAQITPPLHHQRQQSVRHHEHQHQQMDVDTEDLGRGQDLSYEHQRFGQHRNQEVLCERLPRRNQLYDVEKQPAAEQAAIATAAPDAADVTAGATAVEAEMDPRDMDAIEGGDCFVPPTQAATSNAADAAAMLPNAAAQVAAAATAAAAANVAVSVDGMPWATIEVTVAIRPKAGSARRQLHFGSGAGGTSSAVVQAIHNGYVRGPVCGLFDLTRYLTGRDCVRHCGRWVSRSQFEKIGGSTMAKWYRSIRVLPDLEPLGEWLERHDMPVLRGPARRSRKRFAASADSGDEQELLTGSCGGGAAAAAAATLRMLDGGADHVTTRIAAEHGDSGRHGDGVGDSDLDPAPDGWANRMLLQPRDGSGGDDLLVQRLLSSWPLSQPYLRQYVPTAATAAGGVGASSPYTTAANDGGPRPPPQSPQGYVARGSDVSVVEAAAKAATLPQGAPSTAAEPMSGSAPPASLPLLATGPPQSAGVGALKLSAPRSPRLFKALPVDAVRKTLPLAAKEAAGTTEPWPRSEGPTSEQEAAWASFPTSPPPPSKRMRSDTSSPATLRPRLLLHRTAASGSPESSRGGGQPYLFAVQAPPGMLFREGAALSPSAAACAAEAR